MDRKTQITLTKIPNTAQYKGAKWDGLKDKSSKTLDLSSAFAKDNPDVNYFFQVRNGFTLEKIGGNPDRTFSSNDSVFFNNDHLWLGSATDYADTYLVAETYDLSDDATKINILAELRSNFFNQGLDTSTGTTANPIEVKAGFVFVEFSDVTGGDIATLRNKLIGSIGNSDSKLQDSIKKESNGRVKLTLDTYTYKEDTNEKTWVKLSKNFASYKDKYDDVAKEVDSIIEFPDNWKIAIFVFPDDDKVRDLQYSFCGTGKLVDTSQKMQFVFIDASGYDDILGTSTTTTHEVLHALRLRDLYNQSLNRSYGWSIMSDRRAGSHITQFEKLLLGWEDTSKFVFLKRGMIPADKLLNDEIKGIVILPDAGREDTYFIEKAQQIGIGDTNKTEFNRANTINGEIDYGLLLMIFRKDRAEGKIIPFVCRRDTLADCSSYGGASKAPFKNTDSFDTNGISSFSTPDYPTDSVETISRIICVNGAYNQSDQAKILRENEKIVSGKLEFKLDTSGNLLPSSVDCNGNSVSYNLFKTETSITEDSSTGYGYVLFVDDKGTLKLARATDDKALPDSILYTFPKPQGVNPEQGEYFFKVEPDDRDANKVCVAIYKKGETQRKYIVCRQNL